MSFLTGTSSEVLYSSIATGTQLNTFTTEDNLQKTLPYVIIPAGFFFGPNGATGKSLCGSRRWAGWARPAPRRSPGPPAC
jgi:hypothetical protein